MSDYLLYGTKMIENDDTLKDFAESLVNGFPVDDYEDETDLYNALYESLKDDIGRTDIDYEALLYKYRGELGDLLYEIDNEGCETPPLHFFGEEARYTFESLVMAYIDINEMLKKSPEVEPPVDVYEEIAEKFIEAIGKSSHPTFLCKKGAGKYIEGQSSPDLYMDKEGTECSIGITGNWTITLKLYDRYSIDYPNPAKTVEIRYWMDQKKTVREFVWAAGFDCQCVIFPKDARDSGMEYAGIES